MRGEYGDKQKKEQKNMVFDFRLESQSTVCSKKEKMNLNLERRCSCKLYVNRMIPPVDEKYQECWNCSGTDASKYCYREPPQAQGNKIPRGMRNYT